MNAAAAAISWLRARAQPELAEHVERAQSNNLNPTSRELSRQTIARLHGSTWRSRHCRGAVEVAAWGIGIAERPGWWR